MERSVTVVVDTREQRPLVFPKHLVVLRPDHPPEVGATCVVQVHVVKDKLDAGDYALRGYESLTVVERKGAISEVAQNCMTRDRTRFEAALERLALVRDPWLMLEGTPQAILGSTDRYLKVLPGVAVDALMRTLDRHRIKLLLLPTSTAVQRSAAGEWVLRKLLNGALCHASEPSR